MLVGVAVGAVGVRVRVAVGEGAGAGVPAARGVAVGLGGPEVLQSPLAKLSAGERTSPFGGAAAAGRGSKNPTPVMVAPP